jgi:hypothetical protein
MTEINYFVDSVNRLQNNYYTENKKNTFLKNSQKNDCAEIVSRNFSLSDLISNTVYVIGNTNKIFINYSFFKTYAAVDNYHQIIDKFIDLFLNTIKTFGSIELHIDAKTLTTTAIERYKVVLQLYNDCSIKRGLIYDDKILDKIYIYNSPAVINILSILIARFTDRSIKNKLISISKNESDECIRNLLKETI